VRLVVRDSSIWRRTWTQLGADTELPQVNFADQMVVIAGMGSLISGGYDVRVDSVAAAGSNYLIFVRAIKPGEECGVPAVMTQPVDVVRVPRRALPARFVESTEVHRC
jgi:protease stability complex PrcB-like protein